MMQKRVLGKTGEELSIIGFAGVTCATGHDYTGKGNLPDQSDIHVRFSSSYCRSFNIY